MRDAIDKHPILTALGVFAIGSLIYKVFSPSIEQKEKKLKFQDRMERRQAMVNLRMSENVKQDPMFEKNMYSWAFGKSQEQFDSSSPEELLSSWNKKHKYSRYCWGGIEKKEFKDFMPMIKKYWKESCEFKSLTEQFFEKESKKAKEQLLLEGVL